MQRNNKMKLFRKALLDDIDTARQMTTNNGLDVNTWYTDGICPNTHLEFAVSQGNLRAVQFLFEQGADPNSASSRYSCPLFSAVKWFEDEPECYGILKLLLERGADCSCNIGEAIPTPFHLAVQCKHLECVKLFVLYHRNHLGHVGAHGKMALHYAAENKHVDVMQFVVDQGFDIEQTDNLGYSALHYAVLSDNPNGCEVLLRNGANVNRRTPSDNTPVSLAAMLYGRSSSAPVVRVLLEYGADVNYIPASGKSALQYAANWSMDLNSTTKLIIQQVATMDYLNLRINSLNRDIVENDERCREYHGICLQELHDMEETKFYNDVSIRDIFLKSRKVVSGYANNEELIEALERGAYEKRFPIYFANLKKKFRAEVGRQRLRNTAAKTLSQLFKFNDPFHIVNQMILSHLSDDDLIFLQM